MQGGQIQGRPVLFGDDIFLPSCVICDRDLHGCVPNDHPCYDRGLRDPLLRDYVRREHRVRQPNGRAAFQNRTCSTSLAKRERLVS